MQTSNPSHTRVFIRLFCTQNTAQLYHPIIFGRKRSFLLKRAKKQTSTSRLRHIDVEMDMLIFETVEIA